MKTISLGKCSLLAYFLLMTFAVLGFTDRAEAGGKSNNKEKPAQVIINYYPNGNGGGGGNLSNHPPVFDPLSSVHMAPNPNPPIPGPGPVQEYRVISVGATDPDGDTISSFTVSGTHLAEFKITNKEGSRVTAEVYLYVNNQNGNITYSVTDDHGNVTVAEVPVIANGNLPSLHIGDLPVVTTARVGQIISFPVTITDPALSPMTTLNAQIPLNGRLEITSQEPGIVSGRIYYQPQPEQLNTTQIIRLTARAEGNRVISASVAVHVNAQFSNHPPVFDPLSSVHMAPNPNPPIPGPGPVQEYRVISVGATDPDGDTISSFTVSGTHLAEFKITNKEGSRVTAEVYLYVNNQNGNITYSVTDDHGNVTVAEVPVIANGNLPSLHIGDLPVVTTARVGQIISFPVTITDPALSPMTTLNAQIPLNGRLEITSQEPGIVSGRIYYQPQPEQLNTTQIIRLTARAEGNRVISASVAVHVVDTNPCGDGACNPVYGENYSSCPFDCPLPEPQFLRGDANNDGRVNIGDTQYILDWLFRGSVPTPVCLDATDTNDDGRITITDAIRILNFLFGGTENIPPPYPGRGTDPTPDGLGCGPNDPAGGGGAIIRNITPQNCKDLKALGIKLPPGCADLNSKKGDSKQK